MWPISMVASTSNGPAILGSTCWRSRAQREAPARREANTYSRPRWAITRPRTMRAYQAQWDRAMAMITLLRPVPSKVTKKNARTSVGKVMNMSHRRISSRSVRPPTNPATPPTASPSASTSARVRITLPKDRRVPTISRESRSRPRWSVPSQWLASGACRRWPRSTRSGSCGAIQWPNSASNASSPTRARPIIRLGRRSSNG
ncbi:hypothetical protein D3C81_972530 [compost metagenome]